MPRYRDVCTAYLSYLLHLCGVSSTLFSILRRISDVRVAYLAYQWRMCYVCSMYVSLLWDRCDALGVLGSFWLSERILMFLYKKYKRQRSGKGSIRKRFPLQKPRWEKNKVRRQQHKHKKHQDIKQKEPPKKYRLKTISNTKILARLNRFYMAITSS